MASVPDTSHLPWWLGPHRPPSEALLQGAQAGAVIMSNFFKGKQLRAELEQNVQREQTVTALKLMDLQLDKERNQITLQNHLFKQKADIAQAEGTAEIGKYVSNAYQSGKLTDPETQAGYWNLASKLFLPSNVVNSVWDTTFKPAMDRAARASSIGGDEFSGIAYDKYAKSLKDQAAVLETEGKMLDDKGQPEEAMKKRKEAEELLGRASSFKGMVGLVDPGAKTTTEIVESPDGSSKNLVVRIPGMKNPKFIKLPDDSSFKSSIAKEWFNAQTRVLLMEFDKISDRVSTDGVRDPVKLQGEIQKVTDQAVEMGSRKAPGEVAPKEGPSASPTREDFEGWLKKKGLQVPK